MPEQQTQTDEILTDRIVPIVVNNYLSMGRRDGGEVRKLRKPRSQAQWVARVARIDARGHRPRQRSRPPPEANPAANGNSVEIVDIQENEFPLAELAGGPSVEAKRSQDRFPEIVILDVDQEVFETSAEEQAETEAVPVTPENQDGRGEALRVEHNEAETEAEAPGPRRSARVQGIPAAWDYSAQMEKRAMEAPSA